MSNNSQNPATENNEGHLLEEDDQNKTKYHTIMTTCKTMHPTTVPETDSLLGMLVITGLHRLI